MAEMATPELFHRLEEDSSARVRRWVVDHELVARVRFRNVIYAEPAAALAAHGGGATPALWDGTRLFTGAEAVIARLEALLDVGRTD
jgi:hypothetical protein